MGLKVRRAVTLVVTAFSITWLSGNALAGGGGSSIVTQSGQIIGTVDYCGPTGSAGVIVYIPGESGMLKTGVNGNFRFLVVPAGSYALRIEASEQPPEIISPVVVVKKEITDIGTIAICPDSDNDGYAIDLDCNDNNITVYPGAEETCDGIDNNCDGIVDEGCVTCTDEDDDAFAAQAGCGTDVDCNDDDPTINPGANEICGDGVDNDCDASIDEDCPADGDGDGHTADVDCDDSNSAVYPGAEETCNGIDDDCDGVIDAFSGGCYSGPAGTEGIGICVIGAQLCSAGQWGLCQGEITPLTETCNGLDDDCDGAVDNDLQTNYCFTGLQGACGDGIYTCANGSLMCQQMHSPEPELCDGIDNDCDGITDEDLLPVQCDLQAGVCSGSVAACWGASGYQTCGPDEYGSFYESYEFSCDGLDNDCDGLIDEDCPPPQELGSPCTQDLQCISGYCIDNVCCDTICDGTCDGCNAAGLCQPHSLNTDPDNDCAGYLCDGASMCETSCSFDEDVPCAFGFTCSGGECIPW